MKKKTAPAKKSRDSQRSREEILRAAFIEVFGRGFQGVSIDEIVEKTQLTKGAFYHHFPTKRDLGYALVEEVIAPMIVSRWINPLKLTLNPLQGILAQLRALIGEAPPEDLRRGCPLNNLVQEMSPLDSGFKIRLQKALQLWIDGVTAELERAKTDGFLKENVDVKRVARFVVMAHEGFYGMLKGADDTSAFDDLYECLLAYFQTLSTVPLTNASLDKARNADAVCF